MVEGWDRGEDGWGGELPARAGNGDEFAVGDRLMVMNLGCGGCG